MYYLTLYLRLKTICIRLTIKVNLKWSAAVKIGQNVIGYEILHFISPSINSLIVWMKKEKFKKAVFWNWFLFRILIYQSSRRLSFRSSYILFFLKIFAVIFSNWFEKCRIVGFDWQWNSLKPGHSFNCSFCF